jgi:hypothetical protein
MGFGVRQNGKGTRAIRIDADLFSERTSLGQLDRNEANIAAAITFAYEAAAARAQDTYEQDQAVRRVGAAGTFWINDDRLPACMEKANTRGTASATVVVVALEPVPKMATDTTDYRDPKGREQGLPFVAAFVKDVLSNGLLEQIQKQAGLRGAAKAEPK